MNNHSFKLTLIALGCIASAAAFAEDKPDGQWRGSGGAALSATAGNTTSTALVLNADAARATAQDKLSFGAVANYAKSKVNGVETTTADKWNLFGEYDYNVSANMFVFGKLGFEADKLVNLDLRTGLAGGAGYHVIATKETTFDLFGGVGYTTDKYSVDQTVGGKTDNTFSRASIYLGESSAQQLTPTTSFKQRLDLYPGLSGDKAFLAKFNAGLAVAMSSTLSLNVGLTDAYNNRPPVGTKSNDIGLFTGINVKFGAN